MTFVSCACVGDSLAHTLGATGVTHGMWRQVGNPRHGEDKAASIARGGTKGRYGNLAHRSDSNHHRLRMRCIGCDPALPSMHAPPPSGHASRSKRGHPIRSSTRAGMVLVVPCPGHAAQGVVDTSGHNWQVLIDWAAHATTPPRVPIAATTASLRKPHCLPHKAQVKWAADRRQASTCSCSGQGSGTRVDQFAWWLAREGGHVHPLHGGMQRPRPTPPGQLPRVPGR